MKELFVCEKPDQAKSYAESLSKDFIAKKGYYEGRDGKVFTYAFGHLVSCKSPEEINPDWGWKGNVETLPFFIRNIPLKLQDDKKEQYQIIKKLMEQAEIIYNSTDAGREGEHIFRKIYKLTGLNKQVKRIWCQDMTNTGIQKAYANAKDANEFEGLALAGQLREEADLLVGINATQLLTKLSKSTKLLSLGRVQTPTLAMIVKRDSIIESFQKVLHYTIVAETQKKEIDFELLVEKDTQLTKEEAIKILNSLNKRENYTCEIKEEKEKPKNLFDLTKLQMHMNDRFGWSAKKTLDITQMLYEKRKLVTYPRTSSQYIANDEEIPELLKQHSDNPFIKHVLDNNYTIEKSFVDPSKVTDHEAIIITSEIPNFNALSQDEGILYTEIFNRFVSAFYPPAIYQKSIAFFTDNGHTFKAEEKALIKLGWREVFAEQTKVPLLPELTMNNIQEYQLKAKETSPPKRYNEKSLLSDMENAGKFLQDESDKKIMKTVEGIGTPATRAAIIELLINREFVERKGKQLVSTKLGRDIIGMMPQGFSLYSPKLTALFENMLLDVQNNQMSKDKFYSNLETLVKNIATEIRQNIKEVATDTSVKEVVARCPKCGKDMYEGTKNYYCSGYKDGCKTSLWKNGLEKLGKKNITVREAKKLLSGEKVKVNLKSQSGTSYQKEVIFNKEKSWVEIVK
ncbi:DNA topoisomerase [Margalitia sp. FSL K6-0131]|uniref:DNA topoisomerase n=1 Tax=Margalitia sp. FSL K6-0131 TaxID=2954604 RepID=UPI0030FA7C02